MKKLLGMAAVASLITLSACGGGETNTADTANQTEANASIYQEGADNSANAAADAAIGNAADANAAAPAGNAM